MIRLPAPCLLSASAVVTVALGASAPAQTPDDPIPAPEVIVSGGLTPVPADSFARATTVITAEEIERQNPRTIADVLRTVPGIAIARSGGPGGLTEIRVRGAEANQVLVLIDGVEQANSASNVNLGNLRPEQIERIEVVRGPRSALFGSGATAGTINIITKGGREGRFITVEGEAGTAPSGSGSLLVEGGTDRATVAASISYVDDAGWDVSGDDGEKDGAENLTLNLRGQAAVTDFMRIRGNFRFTDRENEFDATSFGCGSADCYVVDTNGLYNEGQDLLFGVATDIDTLGGDLVHTPSLSYATFEDDSFGSFGLFAQDASTLRLGYQAAYTFGPEDGQTVIGAVQYREEDFESTFSGGERERSQVSFVLDYQGQLSDALFVQAGLRWDENDTLQDFLNASISASYSIFSTGTRLRASAGRAQTLPEFFQQFSAIPPFIPNPDLRPERNTGFDVGIDQDLWADRISIGATYFFERLDDAIIGSGNSVDNADGETDRQGIELELFATPLDNLTVRAAYTFLDIDGEDDRAEVRRPEHTVSLGGVYSFLNGRAAVGADVLYASDTVDLDFGDPNREFSALDSYVVVDVTARYALTERVEVYGSITNLFDEDYSQVLGFTEQPLTGFLGLRARF